MMQDKPRSGRDNKQPRPFARFPLAARLRFTTWRKRPHFRAASPPTVGAQKPSLPVVAIFDDEAVGVEVGRSPRFAEAVRRNAPAVEILAEVERFPKVA